MSINSRHTMNLLLATTYACVIFLSDWSEGKSKSCYLSTSSFEELVRKSDCFVDKSSFIKEVFADERALLLTAAPLFGKSVNADMLRRFLEIPPDGVSQQQQLSDGCKLFAEHNLTIYREHRKLFQQHCGQHPVIWADFRTVGAVNTFEEAQFKFRHVIRESYRQHKYLSDSDRLDQKQKDSFSLYSGAGNLTQTELIAGLTVLSTLLQQHFGRKSFVLIDEYDAAFSNLTFITDDSIASIKHAGVLAAAARAEESGVNDTARDSVDSTESEQLKKALHLLTYIIQDVIEYGRHTERAVITGRIQLFGFGYLHVKNLTRYPFLGNHRFARFYGLTQDEVKKLATKFRMDVVNLHMMEDWYDGYRLNVSNEIVKIHRIPSVLKYVEDDEHVAKDYWTDSVGGIAAHLERTFLNENFRRIFGHLLNGEYWELMEMNAYNADELTNLAFIANNDDPIKDPTKKTVYFAHKFLQLMIDCGYFDIINRIQTNILDELMVRIPNREIYTRLYGLVFGRLFYDRYFHFDKDKVKSFGEALHSLSSVAATTTNNGGPDNKKTPFEKLKQSVAQLFAEPAKLPLSELAFKSGLYLAAKLSGAKFQLVELEIGEKYDGKRRLMDLMLITEDATAIVVNHRYNNNGTSAETALEQLIDRNSYQIPDRLDKNRYRIKNGRVYVGLHLSAKRLVTICYLIRSLTLAEKICI